MSTGICRIARNTAFDRLRGPAFRLGARAPIEDLPLAMEEPLASEDALARHEMNECIRRYIDELPPPDRSALTLSEDEGLTHQQIVDVLGISLDTVKIRLHRARRRLKNVLGAGCAVYRDDRNELACEPTRKSVSSGD